MMHPRLVLAGTLASRLAASSALVAQPFAVGTAFTYQGRLNDGGTAATGIYDFQFTLHDAPAAGSQIGSALVRDDVAVASGLFTVTLDFGAVFGGEARFVQIEVRPGASGGAYTALGARQELTPAPNAVFSSTSPWAGLTGKPAGFADDVDNDSGGDITDVATSATSGLTGGAASGSVTLAIASNGVRMSHTSAPILSNGATVVAVNGSNVIFPPPAFSADANGSCFVVAQVSTPGSGESSINTSLKLIRRENGVDAAFGDDHYPVFSAFNGSGIYEATAVSVIGVISGRTYQFGCRVQAEGTFVGNAFTCRESHVCQ
jgi:hypothetical protein